MNSKFKEFWNEFTKDVDFFNKYDKKTAKKAAKEAWNSSIEVVDNNITYRSPELDQDIWQMYIND